MTRSHSFTQRAEAAAVGRSIGCCTCRQQGADTSHPAAPAQVNKQHQWVRVLGALLRGGVTQVVQPLCVCVLLGVCGGEEGGEGAVRCIAPLLEAGGERTVLLGAGVCCRRHQGHQPTQSSAQGNPVHRVQCRPRPFLRVILRLWDCHCPVLTLQHQRGRQRERRDAAARGQQGPLHLALRPWLTGTAAPPHGRALQHSVRACGQTYPARSAVHRETRAQRPE